MIGSSAATPSAVNPSATPRRALVCINSPSINPAATPSNPGAAIVVLHQTRSFFPRLTFHASHRLTTDAAPDDPGYDRETNACPISPLLPDSGTATVPAAMPATFLSPSSTYALILAGGSGTRFWPLSRNARPKQLLDLFGGATLLEQTIARLDGLVPPENILILTNDLQEAAVREIASMLPAGKHLRRARQARHRTGRRARHRPGRRPRPGGRDDGAARRPAHPGHRRLPARCMRDAVATAEKSDGLVTIGIKPTWACPSYGYIERGSRATHPRPRVATTPPTR